MRFRLAAAALAVSGAALALPPIGRPRLTQAHLHDVSPPLTLMRPAPATASEEEHGPLRVPLALYSGPVHDPVLQSSSPVLLAPPIKISFEGIGMGFVGVPPGAAFQPYGSPADPQGDVGPNHYVQIVNSSLAVFAKDGRVVYGPVPTGTVFAGLGGACETGVQFDGIVLYDPLADRWLVSQLAYLSIYGPFYECVAISRTPDPTGSYARYAYAYAAFNDYPKLGVWPDGYYVSYNMFQGSARSGYFQGIKLCALHRARMLQGEAAAQQCVDIGPNEVSGIVPADFDGLLAPPLGAPALAVGFYGGDSVVLYRYRVDWGNEANSRLEAVAVQVAPFQPACSRSSLCVPQGGAGAPLLDVLSDRVMYRAAYRNLGGREALIANHTVTAGSSSGVRWYEIRDPAGDPRVYQQGTYAPDTSWRWMGSAAMDRAGNIGLGFSLSSAQQPPAIAVTGHAVTDPPGVMGQGESVFAGGGSQLRQYRWGDYSGLSVDPSDDCTFWYTAQYIPWDGLDNWRTHIQTFQLPGCTAAPDFAVWVSPERQTVRPSANATMSLSTAALRATAADKDLQLAISPSPLAPGLSATVAPPSVRPGQVATVTITADASAAIGAVPFTVQATAAGGVSQSANGAIAVVDSDFAVAVERNDASVGAGGATSVRVLTSALFGAPEWVAFSASPLPKGVRAVFDPPYARVGDSTALLLSAVGNASASEVDVRVAATGNFTSHSASLHVRALVLPLVRIIVPLPKTNLKGKVLVMATAIASAGTTLGRMNLLVDGATAAGVSAEHSPATMSWNTESVRDGPHALTVRATDADGNVGSSPAVAVWIENKNACGCSSKAGGWEAVGLLGVLAAIRRPRRARLGLRRPCIRDARGAG